MNIKIINSLKVYTEYLSKYHLDKMVLFRGQSEDRPLLPKIARLKLREGEDILHVEKLMFQEFKKKSRPFIDFKPETDWDWLALAQHYGMATRLLDWTQNPLAGLWFAVSKPPKIDKDHKITNGVIWVFEVSEESIVDETEKTNPFKKEITIAFQPNHITRRIVAQQGWFTVHKYMSSELKFIPFERLVKYRPCLTKLLIPGDVFCEIRYDLDRCGVNSASLFPDLDGLCQHITWDHSLMKDEKGWKTGTDTN